jgi:chemotaxis protein CheD
VPIPALMACSDRVIAMGGLAVSGTAGERLITYALGSCLGIVVYDPVATVAGLLHVQLPSCAMDAARLRETPAMFVDSGVPLLFRECYRLGARKERMIVKVAGGSRTGARAGTTPAAHDSFQVGLRNLLALRVVLLRNGVAVQAQSTGGVHRSRTMWIDVASGSVTLKVDGVERPL